MHKNSAPAARNISQIDFREFDLQNGLHLILHQDTTNPIVCVDIWYHIGAKDEDRGKTGIAHLFEHMMFQGSRNVKKTEHFKYINEAGGMLNGSTSHDRTNYFELLPSNQLKLALWLESDRMGYLNVNIENFNNQRDVVKEEKRQGQDNVPYGTRWLKLFSNSFYDEPYSWMPIGSTEDLDNASLDDAIDFYQRYYSPSNAVLVISGDINYDEAFDYSNKYFGSLISNNANKKSFPGITFNRGEYKETVYDSVQIPAVYIGYKVPGLKSDQAPALELLASILGQSKSSRLYSNIVYRKHLAESSNSLYWDNELGGLIIAVAKGYTNSDPAEIEKAMTGEFERLRDEIITDEEIEKAKNILETLIVDSSQTNNRKADMMAYYRTYFRNTEMINTIFDKFSGITASQLKDIASKYLINDNRVVLHYVNKDLRKAA